jgi:dCMP deaminase
MLPGVKARASCPRRQVGAIIVDSGNRLLATGYNGPPSGLPNCTEHPCEGARVEVGPTDLCIALHAEHNAIYFAGDNIRYADTLYCTTKPCVRCALEILQTPITKVVFLEDHKSDAGAKLLREGGRSIWQMKMRLDLTI